MWPDLARRYDADNLVKVEIPVDQMEGHPGKIFFKIAVPSGAYHRRFFVEDYGLAHGVIFWEDWVSDPALTPPVGRNGTIDGRWNVPSEGPYHFSVCTPDRLRYRIGDREIFDLPSRLGNRCEERKINLQEGLKKTEMDFYLANDLKIPEVNVEQIP